jgi:hypothetical protein
LAKEQFFYPATQPLFKKLEQLSQRSSVSRGQAFEDWLTAMVCTLAAETMEGDYLAMVDRHTRGKKGERGVDLMGRMFGELVEAMCREDADILGDLFEGAVTYGEAGQYFSPASVAQLLATITVDPDARPRQDQPIYIHDPCCGTGRMLLEAAKVNHHAELVGQDIDARCTKITAINMGLRGLYGWVICGNSLSRQSQFAYRVGSFFHATPTGLRRGVIRAAAIQESPLSVVAEGTRTEAHALFGAETGQAASGDPAAPKIIEVPRWLARLEPGLAALDRGGDATADVGSATVESGRKEPTRKQQELF